MFNQAVLQNALYGEHVSEHVKITSKLHADSGIFKQWQKKVVALYFDLAVLGPALNDITHDEHNRRRLNDDPNTTITVHTIKRKHKISTMKAIQVPSLNFFN